MNKYIYILAAAAIAFAACGKDDATSDEGGSGGDTPKPTVKAFSVSPLSISVDADATMASITVTSEVAWKASSDNAAIALSPSSGNGNGTIVLSFNANAAEQEVKANITVSTDDKDAETPSYTISFTQAGVKIVPAVKPAPGTVLAEWRFTTSEAENLRNGTVTFEQNAKDKSGPAYAKGNSDGAYVPSNVSGKGKLEYYNGVDKSSTSVTLENKTCVKRCIGNRGEPCIYGTWEGDYFIWSATAENDAPIAAGTKIHLFFALRPNNENVMKYWKCEYLDGSQWKETKTYELKYDATAEGTVESPKQINELINETVTLTADTPSVQFRFTCTQNANCSTGAAIGPLDANYVLRFAGEWPEADGDYQISLQVKQHPVIEVVE